MFVWVAISSAKPNDIIHLWRRYHLIFIYSVKYGLHYIIFAIVITLDTEARQPLHGHPVYFSRGNLRARRKPTSFDRALILLFSHVKFEGRLFCRANRNKRPGKKVICWGSNQLHEVKGKWLSYHTNDALEICFLPVSSRGQRFFAFLKPVA